jgi:hypothetical protein
MNEMFFRIQMARLSGLKFAPTNFATHWEALNALPDDVLTAAVTRAQKTRAEFPSPLELLQDADQVAVRTWEPDPDHASDLAEPVVLNIPHVVKPLVITREWRNDCDECGDTGWRELWCGAEMPYALPTMERRDCGRRHDDNYGHGWAERCPCEAWNPTIRRRKERGAKYAARPGKAMDS